MDKVALRAETEVVWYLKAGAGVVQKADNSLRAGGGRGEYGAVRGDSVSFSLIISDFPRKIPRLSA